jgi:hypothetical protein
MISLPLIEEDLRSLFQAGDNDERSRALNETLVPLAYIFPTVGSFALFLFVLFAAWYYRIPMHLKDQIVLIAAGIPSVFVSSKVSVLFLLNMFSIPQDSFQLYDTVFPFLVFFFTALACMSIFSLCAICMTHLTGRLQFRRRRIIVTTVVILLLLSSSVLGLHLGFSDLFAGTDHTRELISSMRLPSGTVVISGMKLPLTDGGRRSEGLIKMKVYSNASGLSPVNSSPASTCLERIKARQSLRVGYTPDIIPFAFFNSNGSLVGFPWETEF